MPAINDFLNQYGDTFYNNAGLFWVPVALLMAHRKHWLLAVGFVVTCVLTLRLQAELMDSIGRTDGFLPVMDAPAYTRGLIVYSVAIALFLILARFSPRTTRTVFFAAALSIYILAFCLSMLVMTV